MSILTKRRIILGSAVSALAIAPFVIRNCRKTTQLPMASTASSRPKDPLVVPSGKVDVIRDSVTFEPLVLPDDNIRSWTLNATLSNDNKWLFVSYCFNKDCQAKISYASLDNAGLPGTFIELNKFESQSVIMGFGCSSFTDQGRGQFSYYIGISEEGVNAYSNSFVYAPILHSGSEIVYASDLVTLAKIEYRTESWMPLVLYRKNHCWLDGQNAFISVQGSFLTRTDCGDAGDNRFHNLRSLRGVRDTERRSINSNLFLDGSTIGFLEAPARERDKSEKWDGAIDSYRTDPDGLRVSLNTDGTTRFEEPFPVPSFNRNTLLTKTHCFFGSVPSIQFFLAASLEKPQDYVHFRFSRDEIQLPDSGINYVFDPLLILPSGKHVLCARNVGTSFVSKAQELRLPLSTLGIIELPFKIG